MAGINTWRDLLFPVSQHVHVSLQQYNNPPVSGSAQTSSLNAAMVGGPSRLPASVERVEGLLNSMRDHLVEIIDENYAEPAAGTVFSGTTRPITPQSVLERLQEECQLTSFSTKNEASSGAISQYLSLLVGDIYRALTNDVLEFRSQEPSRFSRVVTDHTYHIDNQIKIQWEDKSSHVFERFMRTEFRSLLGTNRVLDLHLASSYTGYKAILNKLVLHAGGIEHEHGSAVRWAVVFCGLNYTIMYIPRTQGRPRVYCSPITKFCLPPGDNAGQLPPIWSMLVYMLLTEVTNIDDMTLMRQFGLDPPPEAPSSSPRGRVETENLIVTSRLRSKREGPRAGPSNLHTGTRANIVIQCLDGLPTEFTLVDAPLTQLTKKMCHQFIHLDHYLGGGWSSVYASRKWHVVVKFATVPKKDQAMLERQLSNETAAYHKLSRIAGWVVPLHYGEFKWDGGRAIILSDEGRSLSHLETFSSLSVVERLIIFGELYCIHLLGVEHGDLEPQNVLQKKWAGFPKIIDFGFANVNHSCPGWNQCGELKDMWHKLGLDKVNLWSVLEKFKITPVTGRHMITIFILALAVLIMKWAF
ncbi:hypothetical protein F5148DRAFT_1288229 [Russula earlei]|uniref:Uncharacterized protein n=1 Tax=Russula earlei TaxID=71964 RepID=A0ACC0U040_9AGAM|nr:hypothetical protein F5148DRAFT_1288229 [Russula earlei]